MTTILNWFLTRKKHANRSVSPGITLVKNASAPAVSRNTSSNAARVTPALFKTQQVITTAATRYAVTRYPFLPFTILVKSINVDINQTKRDSSTHVANVYRIDMNIIGCRRSNIHGNDNEFDLLIYIKERSASHCSFQNLIGLRS